MEKRCTLIIFISEDVLYAVAVIFSHLICEERRCHSLGLDHYIHEPKDTTLLKAFCSTLIEDITEFSTLRKYIATVLQTF